MNTSLHIQKKNWNIVTGSEYSKGKRKPQHATSTQLVRMSSNGFDQSNRSVFDGFSSNTNSMNNNSMSNNSINHTNSQSLHSPGSQSRNANHSFFQDGGEVNSTNPSVSMSRRSSSIGTLQTQNSQDSSSGKSSEVSGKELKSILQNIYVLLSQSKQNGTFPVKAPSKLVKAISILVNTPHTPNSNTTSLFLALFQGFFSSEKLLRVILDYWDKFSFDRRNPNAQHNVQSPSFSLFKSLFTSDQKQSLLDSIMKQVSSTDLTVRSFGNRFLLRFLSLLDLSDGIRSEIKKRLAEIVQKNIAEFGLSSGDSKGKIKVRNLLKLKDKSSDEKIDLVVSCMEIIIAIPEDMTETIRDHVSKITKRHEPHLAKEALNALVALTQNEGGYLTKLASFLPEFDKIPKKDSDCFYLSQKKQKKIKKEDMFPNMNLEDVDSRKYFIKLCLSVIPSIPREWNHEIPYELKKFTNDSLQKWLKCTYSMFYDADDHVFLEAINNIPKKNWAVFLESDPIDNSIILLKSVVDRLNNMIQMESDSNILLSIVKSTYSFVSYFVIFKFKFQKQISADIDAYMESLWATISTLHYSPDSAIRMRAYKSSIWNTNNVHNTVEQLKMEIQGNRAWNPNKIFELVCSLQYHSYIHYEVFDVLGDLCRYLCIQYSSRIETYHLVELCKKQLKEDKIQIFGSKVLSMIIFIMDNCLDGSKFGQNILLSLVEFLGEYSIPICSLNTDKKIINANIRNEFLGIKEKFFRPELYDIQNPAMKSIVSRLMKYATYSYTTTRVAAVKSLERIALLSPDPVRLSIYQFFIYLEQNSVYGLSQQCRSTILLLDEIYELQQEYYQLATNLNPTQTIIESFRTANNLIVEKAKFYCSVPDDWSPLGDDATKFLPQKVTINPQVTQTIIDNSNSYTNYLNSNYISTNTKASTTNTLNSINDIANPSNIGISTSLATSNLTSSQNTTSKPLNSLNSSKSINDSNPNNFKDSLETNSTLKSNSSLTNQSSLPSTNVNTSNIMNSHNHIAPPNLSINNTSNFASNSYNSGSSSNNITNNVNTTNAKSTNNINTKRTINMSIYSSKKDSINSSSTINQSESKSTTKSSNISNTSSVLNPSMLSLSQNTSSLNPTKTLNTPLQPLQSIQPMKSMQSSQSTQKIQPMQPLQSMQVNQSIQPLQPMQASQPKSNNTNIAKPSSTPLPEADDFFFF